MIPDRPDDRAVSEVIGYVLVISLVISTVGIISVSGISILQDARSTEQINNAERAFDLLADNMEDIYREGAPSRSTEIQLGSARVVARQTTTLNVSWDNGTGRERESFRIASLTYRGDGGERLVFEGGAVFRLTESADRGVALRDPPFVTAGDRVVISVPETRIDSTTAVSGSTVLVRANQDRRAVLVQNGSYTDPYVNVTSPNWRAWERTLDARSTVDCTGDAATETVECELTADPETFTVVETRITLDLTR